MGSPLKIKEDRTPAELRRLARRERGGRIAARLYAIANALDGMSRAAAAQLAGMERQAPREGVLRYNTEDLAGRRGGPGPADPRGGAGGGAGRASTTRRPTADASRPAAVPRRRRADWSAA